MIAEYKVRQKRKSLQKEDSKSIRFCDIYVSKAVFWAKMYTNVIKLYIDCRTECLILWHLNKRRIF